MKTDAIFVVRDTVQASNIAALLGRAIFYTFEDRAVARIIAPDTGGFVRNDIKRYDDDSGRWSTGSGLVLNECDPGEYCRSSA